MNRLLPAVSLLLLVGCNKLPQSGRHQLNLLPESYMNDLGAQAYRDARQSSATISTGPDAERLEIIAADIAAVSGQNDYNWKATLFEDDETVNAWCMPGGKIGFYTGILPVLESEAGMAFVMGHEVAHAVLRHGAERMSQQLVTLGGLSALDLYIQNRSDIAPSTAQLILSVLGLGAEVGVALPFSRLHESEADEVGLSFMARAGYPPEEAIAVWDRMEAASGGSAAPPEFLSTHPSYDTRRENLREWMSSAQRKHARNADKISRDTLQPIWSQRSVSALNP